MARSLSRLRAVRLRAVTAPPSALLRRRMVGPVRQAARGLRSPKDGRVAVGFLWSGRLEIPGLARSGDRRYRPANDLPCESLKSSRLCRWLWRSLPGAGTSPPLRVRLSRFSPHASGRERHALVAGHYLRSLFVLL